MLPDSPAAAWFPEGRGPTAAASRSGSKSRFPLTLPATAGKIRSKIRGVIFIMFVALDSDLYKEEEKEKFYDGRYAKKGSFAYMDDWHEEKKQRIVNLIKELDLPERGDALDFGCGTGVLTEVIREALPNYQVYGMDLSHAAIDKAKERYKKCHFFH